MAMEFWTKIFSLVETNLVAQMFLTFDKRQYYKLIITIYGRYQNDDSSKKDAA
jgi:hypothetical protein